jgi:hypothetical protein
MQALLAGSRKNAELIKSGHSRAPIQLAQLHQRATAVTTSLQPKLSLRPFGREIVVQASPAIKYVFNLCSDLSELARRGVLAAFMPAHSQVQFATDA